MEVTPTPEIRPKLWLTIQKTLYIIGALVLFLFALDLMISSLQHLGKNIAETIILATSNPFTGLFIGLLVTAMIQSSSTTTSMVVALAASGSITLQSAIPIIMGANVGTTITSTIVALGFINRKKEFRRAVAAGTYHDFFNILTVVILFPLEYYYGFLSGLSQWIAGYFFSGPVTPAENTTTHFWTGFSPLIDILIENTPAGLLTAIAFVLLFSSILLFRKIIADWMRVKSPEYFSRFFFKNQIKSFAWGTVITAAIRSSTITTSLVVPLVAKKVVTLRSAAPFILGANIGTTITAFIAATLNSNTVSAISIAIAHFLFNFIGVLIFFPIPALREIPMRLARGLGTLTLKYRLAGFVYLLVTFFFLPFSLIYFNQDTPKRFDVAYEHMDSTKTASRYRVAFSMHTRNQTGEWMKVENEVAEPDEKPALLYPVYFKNKTLFIGKDMFLFNKPGFCWDGENDNGKYNACVTEILPVHKLSSGLTFDSVYVCKLRYAADAPADSLVHRYFLSAPLRLMLRHEVTAKDSVIAYDEVIRFSPE